jgi:GAF domain-containing protein/nitrogen-specific signal transduction histidine kinase
MAAIAQLAHEEIADVPTLSARLKTLLTESGTCPQGALVRLGNEYAVLASWGMTKRAANRLLPSPAINGSGTLSVPDGWLSANVGTSDNPGVLVVNLSVDQRDDIVVALAAQISVLWQYALTREEFLRRERAINTLTDTIQGLARQLNVDAFLNTVVEQAAELLRAAGGGIYLLTPGRSTLELRQVAGFPTSLIGTKIKLGQGVVGRVAQSGKALLINEYAQANERITNLPEGIELSAVIAAPLRDDDAVIGVITLVQVTAGRSFSSADQALLESFAAQASLAMRTARLFDAQRKQARDLYVLYENSRTVGSSLDLRHILERLTENVLLALNVEQSTVVLWDAQRSTTELMAVAIDETWTGSANDLQIGARSPLEKGSVAALVINSQQPVAIKDVSKDPRLSKQRGQDMPRSVLGVPLQVLDQVIGVLVCSTYTSQHSFNPSEITLAQTLAGQAAIAIGNARLLSDEKRRSGELSMLQELSTRLNSGIGLAAALEAIGDGVRQLLPNIDLEICLYDPQTETLNSHYATDTTRNYFVSQTGVYHLDQGLTGWLARHRTTLRIGDMRQNRTVRPMRSDSADNNLLFRSFLGVPMLVGDELIGTLELGSSEVNRFNEEDERLLNIIASQAAQALRNVRRYEATDEVLRERVRELLALQRISRELTSTLKLEQLLPAMLHEIVQATGCAYGLVVLNEEEQQPMTVVAQIGYAEDLNIEELVRPLLEAGPLAESVSRAEALIVDDLAGLDLPDALPGVRSLLLAPILYENRVAGAIIAGDVASYAFDHVALDFVRAVADQAALAIGNAQHYAEQVRQRELLQQRASLLNEVLEIGNALRADMDLNALLEQIAFSITEAAGFRVVLFSLIDADQPDVLRTVTGAGLALAELEERRANPLPVNLIHPYLDPQYRLGRAYFVPAQESPAEDTQWVDGDQLLVPLYSTERELIGVISVDDPFTHERPTRRVVETLEIFANQAAIAVENARLFNQRSRQIAELGVVNQISQAATSSLDFNSLAREVYEVLHQALPADSYYLFVFDHGTENIIESWGIDKGEVTTGHANGPVPEDTLTGWIARNLQPLLFTDMPNQVKEREGMQWRAWGDDVPRSWIGVPLMSGDGTIRGILSMQHLEPNRYSERDLALLRTVANQLAVAIENARLFSDAQRRLSELALVNRIGSLTSSTLNSVDILKEVYEALRNVLPVNAFYSFVFDPAHGEIVQRVNVDEGTFYIENQREKLLPESPSQWIMVNSQPLLFSDMPTEMEGRFKVKRFGNPDKWVRSWIGVPLKISDDTSIGLISVQHYQPNIYGEREVALLQTVASQVALAVQNARLFTERERQIRELDAISQIGQLMSASLDLDEMLSQTAHHLQRVTGAPIFYTMVYNPESDTITDGFAIQEGVVASFTPRGTPFPGSLSAWVIRQRTPLLINDTADVEETKRYGITPRQNPVEGRDRSPRAWVGIPILAKDGAPIGMLSLQDYTVGSFDERTVAFLTNVVSHVSLGLQKVQLFNERDRQIKELEAIRRVGQVTSSTLDSNAMMHGVYDVLTEFLPVESFVLNIYDPERDLLVDSLLIDRGVKLDVPAIRPVKPHSLTDWILKNRQPLMFGHLSDELPSYSDIEPLQHGEGPSAQSWMGVPLIASNEQPVGMLALQHYDPNMFDERDLRLLSNVAYQVALGMQNVRLYEQTQSGLRQLSSEAERMALLNHVSNLTSSTLDPQVLYDLAAEEMARATGADQARLIVFEGDEEFSPARAEYPRGDLSVQIPVRGNATIPWMQQHRRPLIINDPQNDPLIASARETLNALGVKALMIVPLIVQGEMIGSVGLDSTHENKEFTTRDAEICQTIANQIAQALENARLFAETQRQAEALSGKVGELSVLLEAGQALSTIREPAQLLDTLVRLVARQLSVDTVVLSTLSNDILLPVASMGLPAEFVERMQVRRGTGLIGTVAASGQPLAINDVQSNVEPAPIYPEFNTTYGLNAFLGVPVLYRSEVMGVLSVMTNTPTEFTPDDIALLSALADQAAIALENARLFGERERQISVLQALNDVSQAITSTLDRQALLRQLHTRLSSVVDTRFSFIALYDNERNMLSFPVVVDNGVSIEQEPLALAEGVLSRVVRGRRTIVLNTVDETAQASRLILGDDQPMASWIGVPIMLGEQVLGVINIQSHTPHIYSADTVQFLQAVASQTAIALENARLFAERESQITQAAILSSISQSMTATLTPGELATSILTGLAPVFDMSNAYIALYDAPTNIVSTTVGYAQDEVFSIAPHLLTNDFLKTMFFEQRPLLFNTRVEQELASISAQLTNMDDDREMIGAESLIAAPITMGSQTSGMMVNQPLGVLVVQSEQANAFTRTQLSFLEAVANQSSSAVQKAMLFTERERRIRELDTLNRISQAVTTTIDLNEILQRLHDGLHEIVDMNTSYIGLYEPRGEQIAYEQAYDQGQKISFNPGPLNISPTRWVIENRQPLLLNTAAESDEYRDEAGRLRQRQTRIGLRDKIEESYLIVPIIVGSSAIGVINIQSYEQYAFSEYDMSFVSTVAAQAGASIANARLFEARERSIQQLRTLSTIGQALSSTVRLEDLLRVIYEQTGRLIDVSNFYLAINDERRGEIGFPLYYERGKPITVTPQRNGAGLTEHVIRSRQPLLLQGGNVAERMHELGITLVGDLARSWLGIPLIAADKVVGMIGIQSYDVDHAYNDDDVQLLSTVANQAAQALENARLFTESRESVRELSTLSETSVSLASTLDIDELLAISASSAIEMARADFGGVIVMDNDGASVTHSLVLNRDRMDLPLPETDQVHVSELRSLRQLRHGQIVAFHDASEDPSIAVLTDPLEIRGVVFLPMVREGLRGVVFVGMDEPYTFEDRSVASLLILTTQIGQAINTAQLFEQIRRFNTELEEIVDQRTQELKGEKERVEALYKIATELGTTLDRDELLVRTLDMAANALNVERGSVLLMDRETKQLICHAVLNEEIGLKSLETPVVFEHGDGLATWVINNNEGVVITDVRNDSRWLPVESGRGSDVRSVIAVPLLSSDAPQGVLMLNSTQIGFFTPDHLRFLSTIGSEVSSALHNSDLYTLVFESADRLSDAMWQQREEASKTSAILQSVSEGVMVLDHDTGRIILYNPAAEQVLRIPRAEVIEQSLSSIAAPRNEVELHEEGRALLLYTGLNEGIQTVQRTEAIHGSIIELPGQMIAANFATVTGEDGSRFGVVVVLRDITREIEADRAKRDFIATVSHELRTPLTPIRGFVDLMLLGAVGQLTEPQREMLGTVKNNTMRMVSLVEDLLEIGRLEAGKIALNTAPSNINQLVREIVSMWNLELENKRMTLDLQLDDTLPLIEYDTKRIGQVLTNLVSNAIKYTYPGGDVTIKTFRNGEGLIQVDVRDTGIGLKPEQQDNLFKRFYRADSPLRDEVGGTGLGLSIAKSFVELHHGEMWVQSVYGEGSTFSISLPEQQPRPDLGEREDMGSVLGAVQPIEETTTP